jgi:DNA-binding XRE family transcriptional regulator
MANQRGQSTGFARRLKELRVQASLTQAALANAVGVHRFTIAKLEQDVSEPYWPTVVRIADALGVSLDAFRPTVPKPPRRKNPKRMN